MTKTTYQNLYSIQRASVQYIGVKQFPEVCAAVQRIAPGKKETTNDEYKSLTKAIKFLQDTGTPGLNYVPLDLESARFILRTDTSFSNASGMKSQLVHLILMADKNDQCNILTFGSNTFQRVSTGVTESEVQGLELRFNFVFLV